MTVRTYYGKDGKRIPTPTQRPTKTYAGGATPDNAGSSANSSGWRDLVARSNSARGTDEARQTSQYKQFVNSMFGAGAGAPPSGGGGGGGRGYGGYGGGGGGGAARDAEMKAAAQSQIDMLMNLARSDAFRTPQRAAEYNYSGRDEILSAANADRARQGEGFDRLDEYVAGLGNAYAGGPQATGADMAVDDLAGLIAAQGGSDAGLRAEAQYMQNNSQLSADAANRQRQSMIDMQDQWNRSLGTEAEMSRQYSGDELSAQTRGLSVAEQRRQQDRLDRVEEQNFTQSNADRQALLQLIAQISQISAGAGLSTPGIDVNALLKGLG